MHCAASDLAANARWIASLLYFQKRRFPDLRTGESLAHSSSRTLSLEGDGRGCSRKDRPRSPLRKPSRAKPANQRHVHRLSAIRLHDRPVLRSTFPFFDVIVPPAVSPGNQSSPAKPRLLLAEDDPSTNESLCEVLRPDYEVVATVNGEQAWKAGQGQRFDLILLDVLIPGVDGISFVQRLRSAANTATVPIILLSASDEKEILLQGMKAGADDFILMPFNPAELLVRLSTHRHLTGLRLEAATRRSDERYRLIVESATDFAIFTLDAQRRVTSWNSGAEILTGYAADDIIGQSGDILFTIEDREHDAPVIEAALAHKTGRFHNERWHMRKDGSRFWGSGIVMPMREQGPEPGSLKIMRDLTTIREGEAARRRAEDRFALIVQSIKDYAIYMLDPEGRVSTWNKAAERVKGFTEEEIIGAHFSFCFTPEDIAAGRPEHEKNIAIETGECHAESWRIRKGARYWGDELLVALRGEDGVLVGFVKFARDLTERKHLEDERTRLLAAEQAARQEAEAANQAKDRFLAALSHELRTPLAPVQMALYLIGREKGLPASVYDGLEMIRRNVASEVRLIGDLLDVSRIVHGKLELNREPMDLHGCIQHALEVCQEDFASKEIQLIVALKARQHRVQGDTARLQQVFWNLFKNAAKFTPAGGAITVRSNNEGRGITVSVTDSGIGIEPAAMGAIFNPFEQGNPDRARIYGGLGLGLAISHAIVAAHDGQLLAESPGRDLGATFRLRLSTLTKSAVA